MEKHYSLKEAASLAGVSYSRAWHTYAYKRLGWPQRVGKTLVLSEDDLAALKTYIANNGDAHVEQADGRSVQSV
jgi:hypothetical protein